MIHFAIVGCGHIANKHIEAIKQTEGAVLSALCDSNPARLAELKEKWDVPVFLDMQEMLRQEDQIDVVCICTPSGLHTSLSILVAEAGKHLVIEKPLALTVEDTDLIAEAANRNGVIATVIHPNRYRPAIQILKEAVDNKTFGKLSHVNATVRWNRGQAYYDQAPWRGTKALDGGVLMNQAIHSLDLLIWLFGPVAEVKSMVDTRIRDIEAEDVAVAVLKFESGVIGVVEACTTVYEQNLEETIAVFGENGYAEIGGRTANWIKLWNCSSMTKEETQELISNVEQNPYGTSGHQYIIEDMVSAIRDKREPNVTLQDGKNAVKLVIDIVNNG